MFPDGVRMAGDIKVFTAFHHSGVVREMILRFKFGGERYLASELAKLSLDSWPEIPGSDDTLFPVPVSSARRRERGYNQAALLASAVARETGSIVKKPLARSGGESQIKVRGPDRTENVKGKFSVLKGIEHTGRAWLIDDVMTTGSTIIEVVSALSDAGLKNVQPAVVCFREISEESIIPCEEVEYAKG